MKKANKKLIEETLQKVEFSNNEDMWGREGFEAGVEWGKSQMEDLMVKFCEFVINDITKFSIPKTPNMYLYEFLKEINDEES